MAKLLRDRYIWAIVALAVVVGIIFYGGDLPFGGLPAHEEWHLTYMAIGLVVFLAGVVIAAWRFGAKGGLVISAALGLIIVPHAIRMAVDMGNADASLELGIFIALGITFS
jgi:hypothetical protein